MDFWFAHEAIVKGQAPGWTWRKFCEDAGVDHKTPLNWFQKYNLPYTITRHKLTGEISPVVRKLEASPEVEEISRNITSGRLSDRDIHSISAAIGKAVTSGAAKSFVAALAEIAGHTVLQVRGERHLEQLVDLAHLPAPVGPHVFEGHLHAGSAVVAKPIGDPIPAQHGLA